MKSKEILISLINYLDEFQKEKSENESLEMNDFLGFLFTKIDRNHIDGRNLAGDIFYENSNMADSTESEIARLVSLMYRYAKHYIKKALHDNIIQTPEEFSFLIVLLTYESLTKSDLIAKNVIEKTSGTEVIKRLLNHGLIIQFDDPNDKRSQRVSITEYGKIEIFKLLPKMHQVSEIVTGNLTEQEKNTLSYLLKKLDHFHHNIYLNDKNSTLEELHKKS